MISETILATRFNSVWQSLAPTLELFVRAASLSLTNRVFLPVRDDIDPHRQAFLSELAFIVAARGVERDAIPSVYDAARKSVAHHPGALREYIDPSATELSYTLAIADRITRYAKLSPPSMSVFEPTFEGCGFLDACNGDVIVGKKLVEIKNVDRPSEALTGGILQYIYC